MESSEVAGVLSFYPGLVGAVLGAWGLWATLRGMREQRTAEAISLDLARTVLREEGAQYRQLLGGGDGTPEGPIDVAFTVSAPGAGEGQVAQGTLADIVAHYLNPTNRRMLITGESPAHASGAGDAGTGKTVLALALVLGLASERIKGNHVPVPVRLTAASWPHNEIDQWLCSRLTEVYHLSSSDAEQVVDAGMVLPVIDGLDEMDRGPLLGYSSRAAALLRAVQRSGNGGSPGPIVLTCRAASFLDMIDSDTYPQSMVHVTISRVDPPRAKKYLEQQVAATPRGRVRWQAVLDALEAATSNSPSMVASAVAHALDTPWRLNLAVTVYQERRPDGTYLRDPADLIGLARTGHLREFLLDHYISAALAAAHRSTRTRRPGRSQGGRSAQAEAEATWRALAALAHYLNGNSTPQGPRVIEGRRLSSTDITLHELWPLAGPRRALRADRAITCAIALPTISALLCQLYHAFGFGVWQTALGATAVLAGATQLRGPVWPHPQRFGLNRLRTRTGRRDAILWLTVGTFLGIPGALVGDMAGLAGGAVGGALVSLTLAVTRTDSDPIMKPQDPVNGDALGGALYAAAFGIMSFLALNGAGRLSEIVTIAVLAGLAVGSAARFTNGFLVTPKNEAGRATLRYFAFLLCSRRQLPWRLGRFLDDCYRLGLLRTAGTAWQFRHIELQEHLAVRADPPSSP
jgi:hypothetical protein